jgi:hypothetical protein
MSDNELPGFLIIGLIIVVADGQVLYRGGRRYLSGPDGGAGSGSMAWMVVTVFHLVAFGLLALLSVVGPSWSGSTAALVGRLGVFLLLMALAHALTLSVLGRQRQDHIVESHFQDRESERTVAVEPVGYPTTEVEVEPLRRTASDAGWQPTVTPVPGQGGPHPRVAPDLENRGPYRA